MCSNVLSTLREGNLSVASVSESVLDLGRRQTSLARYNGAFCSTTLIFSFMVSKSPLKDSACRRSVGPRGKVANVSRDVAFLSISYCAACFHGP
jgi:hypothetical protein